MLTAAEIHEAAFSKSVSGYKASEVDAFLEECAATIDALTAARADLEKKLEVLADKLVEYRNDEDSIRTALLSAQRLGDTVVREANQKAGLILEDARIKAEKIQETAQQTIRDEEAELARVKREVSQFRAKLLSMYHEHLVLIDALPEEEPEPPAAEPAPETLDTASAASETPTAEPTFEPVEQPAAAPPVVPPEAQELVRGVPVLDEDDTVPLAPPAAAPATTAPASKFGDLKFGDDYDITKDPD